jgi:hypothetical protein
MALEKLIVYQLVKNELVKAFHATNSFITVHPNSPTFDPVLSQMCPIHTLIYFNIILRSTLSFAVIFFRNNLLLLYN